MSVTPDNPKRLCIVEDDPDMIFLVRVALRADPRLQVINDADCIEEAVKDARENQPDLILLDHFIHGDIMGLEGAPLLKEVAPHSKILLFTTHDLTIESEREPAVDRYLEKGNIVELVEVIQEMLGLEPSHSSA